MKSQSRTLLLVLVPHSTDLLGKDSDETREVKGVHVVADLGHDEPVGDAEFAGQQPGRVAGVVFALVSFLGHGAASGESRSDEVLETFATEWRHEDGDGSQHQPDARYCGEEDEPEPQEDVNCKNK